MTDNVIAGMIRTKLTARFAPEHLDVIDESHLHAGHAGARPEGETHFRVVVVSSEFDGVNRVGRHRMINETLAHELDTRVHALAIKAYAPGERDG